MEFNQEAWLKPYVSINTEVRTKAKNGLEKNIFKLIINSLFGKTMENVSRHSDIKLVIIDRRISHLVLERNYHKATYGS